MEEYKNLCADYKHLHSHMNQTIYIFTTYERAVMREEILILILVVVWLDYCFRILFSH
jgi:hypothetical protein